MTNHRMANNNTDPFIYNYTSLFSGDSGTVELYLNESCVFEEDVIINTATLKSAPGKNSINRLKIGDLFYTYKDNVNKYCLYSASDAKITEAIDGKYINYY